MALGVPLTTAAANAIFLALATDTGWFRHSSVEPRTFDLAEELVRAGAKPTPALRRRVRTRARWPGCG